jgi:endonuclease/exonuclease/phosphatase (EEP) superfamily protein YafD
VKFQPPSPPYVGPPKWFGSSGNKPIRRIVIHCTAGAEPGVKGAARATASYTKATSRPSSWHYCADSRESVQLTYDSVVAYHDGSNSHSIGYELSCSLSARGLGHWRLPDHCAMLKLAAKDVARLCLAYGVPAVRLKAAAVRDGAAGIAGHNDMRLAFPGSTSHWDPGPFFPWRYFLRLVRAEVAALSGPTPTPTPPTPAPVPAGPSLRVGWWNMRRDRDKNATARAALEVMDAYSLDILALQETGGYVHQLRALPGVRCVAFDSHPGQADTAILVRDAHVVSDLHCARMTLTGWVTVRGGRTPPKWLAACLVDGWLRVGSLHTAPSVSFDGDDTPAGPVRRVASTVQHARAEVAYANAHPGPLLIAGDRNATPDDRGRWSPWWISRKTGLGLIAPDKATHGKRRVIDFALARGVTGTATTEKRHGSDHAVVVATITKESA